MEDDEEEHDEDDHIPLGTDELPEALQFLFDNFSRDVIFVTKDLALRDQGLTALPRILQHFSLLERLNLSKNLLTVLPITTMMVYNLKNLTSLDISDNRIANMENVKQLGMLPNLGDLNLLGNPLIAVNHRSALLGHLIFDMKRPSHSELRALLGYEDVSLKTFRAASTSVSASKVIASEPASKLINSGLIPGNELPHQAAKVLSRSGVLSVYCDMLEAPTPRTPPFPMLHVLNTHVITKEDLDIAALGLPATKVDQVHAGPEPGVKQKKLRGKQRVEQLDKDLDELQQARFRRKVELGMRRLLRHGSLVDVGDADDENELDLFDQANEGSDAAAQQLLCDLVDTVQRKRLTDQGRSLRGGGAAVDENEELEEHVEFDGVLARKHRQKTCPEAWWDADKDIEVDQSMFLLPTKDNVVDKSAQELHQTRQSLSQADAWFDHTSKKGVFGHIREELPYATARDVIKSAAAAAAKGLKRGPGQKEMSLVSFGDLLLGGLNQQREHNRQFLEYRLPDTFKRLKVREWMHNNQRSLAVNEEIEVMFTATNIENKMISAEASKSSRRATSAGGRKKNSDWIRVRELHDRHQERLRIISSGAWPKDEADLKQEKGAHREQSEDQTATRQGPLKRDGKSAMKQADPSRPDRKKDATSEANGGGGGGGREGAGVLSKALDRIERAHTSALQGPHSFDNTASEDAAQARHGDDFWREDVSRARPSEAFNVNLLDPKERLQIEVDGILKSRGSGWGIKAGGRDRGPSDSFDFATSTRSNLREVRRELKGFVDSFVQQELKFDELRRDVGASVDRLIANRRFGEFEARKIRLAGMDFQQ